MVQARKSILVVEDELFNQKFLSSILIKEGYLVRSATNGAFALRSAEAAPPDLILLDVNLPELDGYQVCLALKDKECTKDIPILFLSGRDDSESKLKAFSCGGVDYIEKPFHKGELLSRIQIHLQIQELQKGLEEKNKALNQAMARYKRANKKLLLLNQELEEFAEIISHDLKAPLRNLKFISGKIQKELQGEKSPVLQKYLPLMESRVELMNELLGDIWAYSKAGQLYSSVQTFNPRDSLEKIIATLGIAEENQFTIEVQIHEQISQLKTPQQPLELVLRNLLDNSIKHHHREDGKLLVSAEPHDERFCLFRVKDDGPGIQEKHHQKIFGVFRQLKPRSQIKGTGMGLALVKKIVENFGGTIEVQSIKGEGTTFSFLWPLCWEPVAQKEATDNVS